MKLKKILIFVIVFLIGFGAGIGGMILKEKMFTGKTAQAAAVQQSEQIGPLIELSEFLVNLEGGGMLRTEITLEGVNEKTQETIKAKEIFLRDRILTVLSSKRITDVVTSEGRDAIKKELLVELNKVCPDQIKDVLFKSFVYTN